MPFFRRRHFADWRNHQRFRAADAVSRKAPGRNTPALRNPRHEKFAQLVASGMAANAAFMQVGYNAPQNSPRLRNSELVAKRIEELRVRIIERYSVRKGKACFLASVDTTPAGVAPRVPPVE